MDPSKLLALEGMLATLQRLIERSMSWRESIERYQQHGTESPTSAQSDNMRSSESVAFEFQMAQLIRNGDALGTEKDRKERSMLAATHFNKNPEYAFMVSRLLALDTLTRYRL